MMPLYDSNNMWEKRQRFPERFKLGALNHILFLNIIHPLHSSIKHLMQLLSCHLIFSARAVTILDFHYTFIVANIYLIIIII